MVELLVRWSLKNRTLVVLLAAAVSLVGAWLGMKMPIDVLPDLTAPTVTVVTEGRTLSPQEMESQVTIPIEGALNGASGVRRVRSGTALGLSVVWVEFDWDTDITQARQVVSERLALVAGRLPAEAGLPKLTPASSIMGEVLFFSLVSQPHDDLALRTTAQTLVRRRLLTVSGVSQVSVLGGSVQQFQIVLAQERMAAFGLDASDVVRAIEQTSGNVSGGVLVEGSRELVIEGLGRARTLEDLVATVVDFRDGRSIRVADLGLVRIGAAARRGSGASAVRGPDGTVLMEEAVILAVQKQPGVGTLELTRLLDRALDEITTELPAGMSLRRNLFRQASFIERAVQNTSTALIEGAAMVVLVVLVFLASVRTSLVTLVVLPVSVLTTGVVLYFTGGINTMTLGGLAIAIGALVDDAIIDVENIVRRLRENHALPEGMRKSSLVVIYSASVEVRASIVLATVIILLAFSPLFFLSGIEGKLLMPLGIAFTVALAVSLLVALTLTPALCAWSLPESRAIRDSRESTFVRGLKRAYQPVLAWSLDRPMLLALLGLSGLLGAAVGLSRTGTGFLPEFNEGAMTIGLVTEPGTSLEQSTAIARNVDAALMRHLEIVAVGRRTGRAEEDEHVQGVEASEIDLTLDMQRPLSVGKPLRTREDLLAALRSDLGAIPGVQASFGQPISHRIDHMLSGTRAGIAIKIHGTDLLVLREMGTRVQSVIQHVPGVVDISAEQQSMVPSLRIVMNRELLALHGVPMEDANRALLLGTAGIRAGQILEGSDVWDIVVRTDSSSPATAEALTELRVPKPDGTWVPLRAIADIREDRVPNFISREALDRKFVVSCNAQGRDLGSVVNDIRKAIETEIPRREGVRIEFGGQFESAQSTRLRLLLAGGAITLLVVLLLFWMFHSIRDTILVLANMPLALIGAVAGVHASGGVLTVASMIGFITVFGIAVRNGIMLVSHIRHLQQEEGVSDLREAVRRSALERLSPILMTALAAGLALIPLAWRSDEPGNEILSPMAIVILFGLLSSTALNMLLVPSFYLRWGRPQTARQSGRPAVFALSTLLLGLLMLGSCQQTSPRADWATAHSELERSIGLVASDCDGPPRATEEEFVSALEDGLSLDEAMRLALLRSPRLRACYHAVGASQAEYQQAIAIQNPSLALGWLFPEGGGRSQWTADLLQPLADAWLREPRAERARVEREQALVDLSLAAREILCATRTAWIHAAQARARAEAAARELHLTEERLTMSRDRVELGLISAQSVAQAEWLHNTRVLEMEKALTEARDAGRQLASCLAWEGRLDETPLTLLAPSTTLASDAEALLVRAEHSRLDLRAAALSVERARADLELARQGRWTGIEIGLSAERPGEAGSTLLGPAASLEIPLNNRQAAAVAAAEQRLLEQQALRDGRIAGARHEILAFLDRLQATQAHLQRLEEQQLPALNLRWKTLQAAQAAGDITRLELIEVEAERLALTRDLQSTRWLVVELLLKLEEASGDALLATPSSTTPAPEPRGP
jgi:CzcA family heavy metal efflux pump